MLYIPLNVNLKWRLIDDLSVESKSTKIFFRMKVNNSVQITIYPYAFSSNTILCADSNASSH